MSLSSLCANIVFSIQFNKWLKSWVFAHCKKAEERFYCLYVLMFLMPQKTIDMYNCAFHVFVFEVLWVYSPLFFFLIGAAVGSDTYFFGN